MKDKALLGHRSIATYYIYAILLPVTHYYR